MLVLAQYLLVLVVVVEVLVVVEVVALLALILVLVVVAAVSVCRFHLATTDIHSTDQWRHLCPCVACIPVAIISL